MVLALCLESILRSLLITKIPSTGGGGGDRHIKSAALEELCDIFNTDLNEGLAGVLKTQNQTQAMRP